MKYLVSCACGHTLDRHDGGGCAGDGAPCGCRRSQETALDAAIEAARTDAGDWRAFLRARESGAEAGA